MLRSNRASVPSVVRSLYIKKKDKFRIQMYKEIKENLINISSSILSVQNKMVNVYYKGNSDLTTLGTLARFDLSIVELILITD
jgi:hypothetical protein